MNPSKLISFYDKVFPFSSSCALFFAVLLLALPLSRMICYFRESHWHQKEEKKMPKIVIMVLSSVDRLLRFACASFSVGAL